MEPAFVPSDQAALKSGLEEANVRGLLPHDQPVFRALDKFIDPPEYQISSAWLQKQNGMTEPGPPLPPLGTWR